MFIMENEISVDADDVILELNGRPVGEEEFMKDLWTKKDGVMRIDFSLIIRKSGPKSKIASVP